MIAGCLALALLAACGGDAEIGSAAPEGSAAAEGEAADLPADGRCRAGVIVGESQSCIHEFSYQTGTRITDSGAEPIVERQAITFRVDSDGTGHYGDRLSGTEINSTVTVGDIRIAFVASARDDGSFLVEEATEVEHSPPPQPSPDGSACTVGAVLAPGDSCTLAGGDFSVDSGGQGCFNGSICAGSGLDIGGFSAERRDDGWRITSLP